MNRHRLEYGNGEVLIKNGNSVKGFDILIEGKFEVESLDPHNFMIINKGNRIMGVAIGSNLGNDPFLKYTGDLKIIRCIIVTDNLNKKYIETSYPKDTFDSIGGTFSTLNEDFESLDKDNKHGTVPKVSKKTFLNKNLTDKDGKKIKLENKKTLNKQTINAIREIRTSEGY